MGGWFVLLHTVMVLVGLLFDVTVGVTCGGLYCIILMINECDNFTFVMGLRGLGLRCLVRMG